MRWTRLCLLFSVLVAISVVPGNADGFILAPPRIASALTETTQVAFIEVRDDHSVVVDLYIGLLSESGKEHTVLFAFPFFSDPEDFALKEVPDTEIRKRSGKLDHILVDYLLAKRRLEEAPVRLIPAFSLLCTPVGPILMATANPRIGVTQKSSGFYETQHARVEIVGTSLREDLPALARRYSLAEPAMKAIKRYMGKPVAIVTIRSLSREAAQSLRMQYGGSLPVLHLHFAQRMARTSGGWRYAYPLGTGAAWATPVSGTSIYVLGDAGKNIKTKFPGAERLRRGRVYAGAWRANVVRAAEGDTQVHRADYRPHNYGEDIWVTVLDKGKPRLPSQAFLLRSGYPLLLIAMFALAVSSWVGGVAVSRRLVAWPPMPFARACGVAWLLGVLTLGLFAAGIALPIVAYLGRSGSIEALAEGVAGTFSESILMPVMILALCGAVVLLVRLMISQQTLSPLNGAFILLGMAAFLVGVTAVVSMPLAGRQERLDPFALVLIVWAVGAAVLAGAVFSVQRTAQAAAEGMLSAVSFGSTCIAALASTIFYLTGSAIASMIWLSMIPS